MKIHDAADILKGMYQTAPEKEKAVHVHLFGIQYAEHIKGMALHELAELADIPRSYGTEIRKGINLARYVQLRT